MLAAPDYRDAAAEIAARHLDEARRQLPALVGQLEGCGPKGVMAVIGSLFGVFPQPQRTEDEWRLFWEGYVAALEDLPLWALEAARIEWLRRPDAEWLPKPGPFRAIAVPQTRSVQAKVDRIRLALDLAEGRRTLPGGPRLVGRSHGAEEAA